MTPTRNHSAHSHLISGWRAKHQSPYTDIWMKAKDGATYTLQSPLEGYVISITFGVIQDHPGNMRVRATNWRAEDEPNGIYDITDCRKFYRTLLNAGFVEVKD